MLHSLLILPIIAGVAFADTPGNCTYGEIQGKWTFYLETGHGAADIECDKRQKGGETYQLNVELLYPDVVIDQFGNKGFWTMIYNQGYEAVVNGRKYFAFSKYEGKGENATSYCGETMEGWSHDILGKQWTCFHGKRQGNQPKPKMSNVLNHKQKQPYKANIDFINQINSVQSLWKATYYDEYMGMSVGDLMKRAGGKAERFHKRSLPKAYVKEEIKKLASSLPNNFDWRNRDGMDFVSPVRNQGNCGSCYAFSAMGMLEARIRIQFNNTYTPTLSPQDIVECSKYSQGCDGGFPYLIAGKYAEDFGVVEESCTPYTGKDGQCSTATSCERHYASAYKYVGGYYGGCNEEEMKLALYKNGPMSVSFEVEDDFMHYKGGIYQHTGLEDKFNPFELTNHAVLLVGWGEEAGVPFWIVKNSWGAAWGEQGFFRIIRGQDEVAMESLAVESFPIF